MRAMLKVKGGASASERSSEQNKAPEAPPTASCIPQAGTTDRIDVSAPISNAAGSMSSCSLTSRQPFTVERQKSDGDRDIIDRGLISIATAKLLLETYRRDLYPLFPMVAVPQYVTMEQMRQSRPTLFLTILAAAAMKDHPHLSAALDKEILQNYATRSLVQSEKSLQLVQSFLLSAVWYHPPKKFEQLKYYEYIHMAATMAMDMGIGTRPVPHRSQFGPGNGRDVHHLEDARNPDLSMSNRSGDFDIDTSSLESRRTFVSCYCLCTGVSINTRRPNMLRKTFYLKECVDYIEQCPDAEPADRRLVAWARLLMISDEIAISFSYDDPGGIASISELKTQMMLKDFGKRLETWHREVPENDMSQTLLMIYWSMRLYLHEVALHVDHSPDDFNAPFQMGTIHRWQGEPVPTGVLAEAVAECITCCHNVLTTFIDMDAEALRALPILGYVRISFAAFVLAKLCLSASHPESQIARVLDRDALQAQSILDRTILHVKAAVGTTGCKIPSIFLALLFKLRQWCLNPMLIEESKENILEPEIRDRVVEDDEVSLMRGKSHRTNSANSASQSTPGSNTSTHAGSGESEPSYDETRRESVANTHYMPPTTLNPENQVTSLLDPADQMELDQNFFQLFQDMAGFDDVNAAGYESWAPSGLFGGRNDFYFPPPLGNGQAPVP